MSDEVPQSVKISGLQKAEIKRFVKAEVFTTDADAIRRLLEEGTEVTLQKHGMKPLRITGTEMKS